MPLLKMSQDVPPVNLRKEKMVESGKEIVSNKKKWF
jgi:hypothetical protein